MAEDGLLPRAALPEVLRTVAPTGMDAVAERGTRAEAMLGCLAARAPLRIGNLDMADAAGEKARGG